MPLLSLNSQARLFRIGWAANFEATLKFLA